jgi:hypothetical protein
MRMPVNQALSAGQAALDNAEPVDAPDEDDAENCRQGKHAMRIVRRGAEMDLYRCAYCRFEEVD